MCTDRKLQSLDENGRKVLKTAAFKATDKQPNILEIANTLFDQHADLMKRLADL